MTSSKAEDYKELIRFGVPPKHIQEILNTREGNPQELETKLFEKPINEKKTVISDDDIRRILQNKRRETIEVDEFDKEDEERRRDMEILEEEEAPENCDELLSPITLKDDQATRDTKTKTCLRNADNISHRRYLSKINEVEHEHLDEFLNVVAPKVKALMDTIRVLDTISNEETKTAKHLIYSDLKCGFGQKLVMRTFEAYGYKNWLQIAGPDNRATRHEDFVDTPDGRFLLADPVPDREKENNENRGRYTFGVLSSSIIDKEAVPKKAIKLIKEIFNGDRGDNSKGQLMRFLIIDSGFMEGTDVKDIKYMHILERLFSKAAYKQVTGRGTRRCGQRNLQFIPCVGWPLQVFHYYTHDEDKKEIFDTIKMYNGNTQNSKIAEELEECLCDFAVDASLNRSINKNISIISKWSEKLNNKDIDLKDLSTEPEDIVAVTTETPDASLGSPVPRMRISAAHRTGPYSRISATDPRIMPNVSRKMTEKVRMMIEQEERRQGQCVVRKIIEKLIEYIPLTTIDKKLYSLPELKKEFDRQERERESEMQHKKLLEEWESYQLKLEMNPKWQAKTVDDMKKFKDMSFKDYQKEIEEIFGLPYEVPPVPLTNGCLERPALPYVVRFTKSQQFLAAYYCHESPFFKGMLVYHSVGTGKTCTAVLIRSMFSLYFEDYKVIWVTRAQLIPDVTKNMYREEICDYFVREEYSNTETISPVPYLATISYLSFSNALEKKNNLGRALAKRSERSGKPLLDKILLIFDEAHLLPQTNREHHNFNVIRDEINKCDTCRTLLMTGSPVDENKLQGLFDIMNLTFYSSDRFKFPNTLEEYKRNFLNEDGALTNEGKRHLRQLLKGRVSCLQQTNDQSVFAQIMNWGRPVLRSAGVEKVIESVEEGPLITQQKAFEHCLKGVKRPPDVEEKPSPLKRYRLTTKTTPA